jgi:hypothetical protein
MVTVCPPIVIVPVRAAPVVFSATEYVTVPLPMPLSPDVIVIHEPEDDVTQVQLLDEGVTVMVPIALWELYP